jgi:hypothetical protein
MQNGTEPKEQWQRRFKHTGGGDRKKKKQHRTDKHETGGAETNLIAPPPFMLHLEIRGWIRRGSYGGGDLGLERRESVF